MTTRERIGLTLFVGVMIAIAVTWQIGRYLGFELWMFGAGLAGGVAIAPWVWFQTRPRF